jgi:hypothetical protein
MLGFDHTVVTACIGPHYILHSMHIEGLPCVYTKSLASLPLFDSTLHCAKNPRLAPQSPELRLPSSLATKAMPMKSYSRKGRLALVLASSSVLALPTSEEARPMVRPASVSTEALSTSSLRRPCSHRTPAHHLQDCHCSPRRPR